MNFNNFNSPRPEPIGRLGVPNPSSTRIRGEVKDARDRQDSRLARFDSPYAGFPKSERRNPGRFENKVLATGVAALALLGAGALYAGSKGGSEGSLAHPDRAAITKQATKNQNLQQAEQADQAARAAANEPTQADIEGLQHEQAQLNRPPESK